MSSPSDNGTVSSSGRSSPDDPQSSFQRRASTPAQSFLPPRFWSHSSSSGGGGNSNSNTNSNSMNSYYDSTGGFSSLPRRTSFGTTFSNGGRLSALSALGMSPSSNPALYGFSSSSGSALNQDGGQNRQPQPPQPQRKDPSGGGGVAGSEGNSARRDLSPSSLLQSRMGHPLMRANNDSAIVTTPDATPTPSMPSSPVQKPRKRSVCLLPGPDGLCVESRGRRRSEA